MFLISILKKYIWILYNYALYNCALTSKQTKLFKRRDQMNHFCCYSMGYSSSFAMVSWFLLVIKHAWIIFGPDPFRSGKNPCRPISWISNSVTYLWSYTDSTIADVTGNYAAGTDIVVQSCWSSMYTISSHRTSSVWLFHDVSQCFKSVSWCFLIVYEYFLMFI